MKLLVIANPASGSFKQGIFDKTMETLKGRADEVVHAFTESAGHATTIARDTDADFIIAAGGDGLINEVVNGLAEKKVFFSVLPFGTANVFARELGMSLYPVTAAKQLNLHTNVPVFLGSVADRYFIQMAGFGFDAQVVEKVTQKKKHLSKALSHVTAGLSVLRKGKFPPFSVYSQGQEYTAHHLILSLGKKYGGSFPLVKHVTPGTMAACMLERGGRLPLIKNAVSVGMHNGFRGRVFETEMVKVTGPTICQLDGEFVELPSASNYIRVKRAEFLLVR